MTHPLGMSESHCRLEALMTHLPIISWRSSSCHRPHRTPPERQEVVVHKYVRREWYGCSRYLRQRGTTILPSEVIGFELHVFDRGIGVLYIFITAVSNKSRKYILSLFGGCQCRIHNLCHFYNRLFLQSPTDKLQTNRGILEFLRVI